MPLIWGKGGTRRSILTITPDKGFADEKASSCRYRVLHHRLKTARTDPCAGPAEGAYPEGHSSHPERSRDRAGTRLFDERDRRLRFATEVDNVEVIRVRSFDVATFLSLAPPIWALNGSDADGI